jgi:DNA mismatch repair protein MutS
MTTESFRLDGAEETPLMKQWRDAKAQHPDALLFFRVGDFFELFGGDAEEGSRLLGLTLTSRNNGAASRVPLAGVPAKALDDYLARLIKLGRRVAICDQVEDPAEAKGIVRREVVETVTPGSVVQDGLLHARRNTFLVALSPPVRGEDGSLEHGLAVLDLSTGDLTLERVPKDEVADALGRTEATELLVPRSLERFDSELAPPPPEGPVRTRRDDWLFDGANARETLLRQFGVQSVDGFGFQAGDGALVQAAGALLAYVQEIRPGGVHHIRAPRIERAGRVMLVDEMTRRNLELVEPLRAGEEGGTLLSVVDHALTSMGGRLLRRWLLTPLLDAPEIWQRQEAVAELVERSDVRRAVRERLALTGDLGRLAGRVGSGRATPRDLSGLARSLAELPALTESLSQCSSAMLIALRAADPLADVQRMLADALAEDPPLALQDGGVIRRGYAPALDELRDTLEGARDFIAGLQARERERTGIASLRVGYNKVFGYYLEVTRANVERVPADYHRKQTLANAERYFTPELKSWEERVLTAEERVADMEVELFADIRRRAQIETARLQVTAEAVAQLDVLAAFAEVAVRGVYVRPVVHTGFDLRVLGGRHPVVETMMPRERFIPNDLALEDGSRVVILTGPNMAGKSTVLRQMGLIQLLAQVGSFVPATEAYLPIVDRIFTRVGASDNLARGQSTFMVEMNETAAILNSATERSLVLLDEIGRGTSTYDGVSIAWAVTEHLHERVGAKTVFATHYHELTQLGDLLPRARNMNVAVRETEDTVVFLRRLEAGGADRSYGIQVAKLAGLPPELLARARELLVELEGAHAGGGAGLGLHGEHRPASEPSPDQLSLFAREHPVVDRLRRLDIDRLTPLEALNVISALREEARGGRAVPEALAPQPERADVDAC